MKKTIYIILFINLFLYANLTMSWGVTGIQKGSYVMSCDVDFEESPVVLKIDPQKKILIFQDFSTPYKEKSDSVEIIEFYYSNSFKEFNCGFEFVTGTIMCKDQNFEDYLGFCVDYDVIN